MLTLPAVHHLAPHCCTPHMLPALLATAWHPACSHTHRRQSMETMRTFMMAMSATALAAAAALGALLTLRPGRAGGLKLMYLLAFWPGTILVQVGAAFSACACPAAECRRPASAPQGPPLTACAVAPIWHCSPASRPQLALLLYGGTAGLYLAATLFAVLQYW